MPKISPVSPSRDGDQFHYLRGARLCLELLKPGTDLVAVTIEGVPTSDDIEEGVDVIDLGLFTGSTELENAKLIQYRQFKHSTLRASAEMTASDLVKTLKGFAERYGKLVSRLGADDVARRVRFEFETNRPIASTVYDALDQLKTGKKGRNSDYLRANSPLTGGALQNFAGLVRLLPNAPDYLSQRLLLAQQSRSYLPDADRDAPLQLKELVTRKATSEGASDRAIRDMDVLTALGVSPDDLRPAKPLFDFPNELVEREQMRAIVEAVIGADQPLILQADSGVGKSVVANQLGRYMPVGSRTFVYDCFGAGSYRSASGYRHRAREAAVQLANEMAAVGLCDPLIPTSKADEPAYVRAFLGRVEQASALLAASAGALIVLVLDAADNSESAAPEAGDAQSFPRMILRERLPANVRLVLTARPYRVESLQPPPEVGLLMLEPFTEAETVANLARRGLTANAAQTKEFHRLTSSNPRVQSVALEGGGTIDEVLARLGPTPLTVEDTIETLLQQAVARIRDVGGKVEGEQVDLVCTALATLRPFVPLSIVAETAGVSVDLVRSFAHDLQGPLLIREDAVQFRDEPTENWFQKTFRPTGERLAAFVRRLRPLTAASPYVAAVLPQMMLEAGQLDELVAMVLSGEALPNDNEVARRDVELQRLQFALKAAIRAKRYKDAACLAMKAGGNAAADERQQKLISENCDLASRFLEPNQLLEMISRREIAGGDWMGSEHAYQAALLSGQSGLTGDASKELRFALTWLGQWARLVKTGYDDAGRPDDEDRAAMLLAELNINGSGACASHLRRWRHREVSYRAGSLLIRRLVDAGRFADVDELTVAAGNDIGLLLAITVELAEVDRVPPKAAVERAVRLVASRHVTLQEPSGYRAEETLVLTVAQLVMAAARHRLMGRRKLTAVLGRYMPKQPPRALSSRFPFEHQRRFAYLRAYSVLAALRGRKLRLKDLAEPGYKKLLARSDHQGDGDFVRFKEDIGTLLPWHELLCAVELGRVKPHEAQTAISRAHAESKQAEIRHYRDRSTSVDEVAILWSHILTVTGCSAGWAELSAWRETLDKPLYTSTLTDVARRASLAGAADTALASALAAAQIHMTEQESAEDKANSFLAMSRAVLTTSEAEAKHYFDQAVLAGSRIGEENVERWTAVLHLASAGKEDGSDKPELAYALARAAELTWAHVARDKYFDWEETIRTLVGLSPRSAMTILSRWADRRFGHQARIVPIAVGELVNHGHLSGSTALCLLPFQYEWELPRLLEAALASAANRQEAGDVAATFWQYSRFLDTSGKNWRSIAETLRASGLPDTLAVARAEDAQERERALEVRRNQSSTGISTRTEVDWTAIFANVDLTTSPGIAEARLRYRGLEQGFYSEDFYKAAAARVRAGTETLFLDALAGSEKLDLYELRGLLQVLPPIWRARPAVGGALNKLVRAVFRDNCFRVCAGSCTKFYRYAWPAQGASSVHRSWRLKPFRPLADLPRRRRAATCSSLPAFFLCCCPHPRRVRR